MPVAVQGRRAPPEEKDPIDQILKGLQIASSFYGISQAGDRAKELAAEKESKTKKEALETDIELARSGLKIGTGGKVEPDLDSPFLKKKLSEKEIDPNVSALREITLAGKVKDVEEKAIALETPYGKARTLEDAKALKAADEEKKNFDNKIDEMIAIREKHRGGAIMNREDVARGKQLSKDALLSYKNMAKLGVLSQSDEAIINAIIPPDPLQYNSPIAAVQGQDPVLNNLKKFKEDSDKDFQNKLANRIRPQSGLKNPFAPAQKQSKEETRIIDGAIYKKVQGGWEPK